MTDEQLPQDQEEFVGPGTLLQQARKQAGLSVEQIAGKLNLKPQNILDIESEQFDDSISVTFTRGYLKAYAKQVNVNEGVILEAFESLNACSKEPAKLQSFSRRVANQASDDRLMLVSYAILIVILGLFVAWWWQQDSDLGSASLPDIPALVSAPQEADNTPSQEAELAIDVVETTATEAQPQDEQSTQVDNSLAEVQPSTATTDTTSSADSSTPVDDIEQLNRESQALNAAAQDFEQSEQSVENTNAAEDVTSEVQEPLEALENSADTQTTPLQSELDIQGSESPAEEVSREEASLSSGDSATEVLPVSGDPVELVFEFSDDCWMQLTDATGEAIAYGVKVKGRVMTVSGIPPFEVILGAPAAVSINYGGEAINMAQFPKNRTARFNLPLSE